MERTPIQQRIDDFVDFCIEHQVKVSIIMWLMILYVIVTLLR